MSNKKKRGKYSEGPRQDGESRKEYTDEERIRAVALARHYGNIRRAAKELGITASSLGRWMRGIHVDDVGKLNAQVEQIEESMLQRVEAGAMEFYEKIMEELRAGNYSRGQLLTGFGILADKVIALKRLNKDAEDFGEVRKWVSQLKEAQAKYGKGQPQRDESVEDAE